MYGDDWAVANRIWNDLLLRGIVPKRLPEKERDIDFWGESGGFF